MRDYLSLGNLWKAVLLGAAVTLMSIPRIIQGGMPVAPFAMLALFGMTLISGAATAWGEKGGMCGLFPGWRRTGIGLGLAALLTIIAAPISCLWLDPRLYGAIEATGDTKALTLAYPDTAAGKIASVLWSGGFHVMFFVIAGMSFLARLTGKATVSIAIIVVFRVAVGLYKAQEAGMTDHVSLLLLLSAVQTACSCLLFARTGLLPTMVFAMGMETHLFF